MFGLRENTLFPEPTVGKELDDEASEETVASLEARASPFFDPVP